MPPSHVRPRRSVLLCRTHLLIGTEGAVQVCTLPPSVEADLDCDLDHEIASGEENEGAARGEATAAAEAAEAAAAVARRGRRLGGTRCEVICHGEVEREVGEVGEVCEVATPARVSDLWLVTNPFKPLQTQCASRVLWQPRLSHGPSPVVEACSQACLVRLM